MADEGHQAKRCGRLVMSHIYVTISEVGYHKRAKPFKSVLSFVLPGVESVLLFYFCVIGKT